MGSDMMPVRGKKEEKKTNGKVEVWKAKAGKHGGETGLEKKKKQPHTQTLD